MRQPFDPSAFEASGRDVVALLAAHLEAAQRGQGPVMGQGSPAALTARFPADFPREGNGALLETLREVLSASTRLHAPGFLGHQVATPLPAAALCELVAALLNNGMAVFEMGPAGSAMERAVLSWLAGLAGLPATAGGVLTSGGSLGNLTALLAARQAKAPIDVWRRGLRGGPPLCVFVGESAHYSVARAVRILGLGDDGVVMVDVDAHQRMRPDALAEAIAAARKRKRHPIAVVASAASTATGAFDPLDAIADVCAAEGLWLHVDGAHGASLLLSARHRDKLTGVARADSLVWDAHKLMMMPALVTGVLFRDGKQGAAAFAQDAGYLFPEAEGDDDRGDGWADIGRRTVECTKRMMALPLYTCLRAFGTATFEAHVDRCCALAGFLAASARKRRMEVLVEPACNIVCFRPSEVTGSGTGTPGYGGKLAALRQRIVNDGRFYIVRLHRRDGLWLRSTLANPATTEADIEAMLDAVEDLAAEM